MHRENLTGLPSLAYSPWQQRVQMAGSAQSVCQNDDEISDDAKRCSEHHRRRLIWRTIRARWHRDDFDEKRCARPNVGSCRARMPCP